MVTNNNEKMQELTVEEKLQNLYELQRIDTEIDKIKTLRGELPLEVQDLEDEIAGLETRIENLKVELGELDKTSSTRKMDIKKAEEVNNCITFASIANTMLEARKSNSRNLKLNYKKRESGKHKKLKQKKKR